MSTENTEKVTLDNKITSRAVPNGSRLPSKEETLANELMLYLEHKVVSRTLKFLETNDKSSHQTLMTHYRNACVEYSEYLRGLGFHMMAQLVMSKLDN